MVPKRLKSWVCLGDPYNNFTSKTKSCRPCLELHVVKIVRGSTKSTATTLLVYNSSFPERGGKDGMLGRLVRRRGDFEQVQSHLCNDLLVTGGVTT